jgi:hypothetical protein
MPLDEVPDQSVLDISVFVRQNVPLRHDPAPGNLRMRLLEGRADTISRLSDDFDRTLDRKVQHRIF